MQDRILKAAGRRGKTKAQLAEQFGVGFSYISRNVNELVDAGLLVGTVARPKGRGRPATRYARVDS